MVLMEGYRNLNAHPPNVAGGDNLFVPLSESFYDEECSQPISDGLEHVGDCVGDGVFGFFLGFFDVFERHGALLRFNSIMVRLIGN
jgi:hypothetical protein